MGCRAVAREHGRRTVGGYGQWLTPRVGGGPVVEAVQEPGVVQPLCLLRVADTAMSTIVRRSKLQHVQPPPALQPGDRALAVRSSVGSPPLGCMSSTWAP